MWLVCQHPCSLTCSFQHSIPYKEPHTNLCTGSSLAGAAKQKTAYGVWLSAWFSEALLRFNAAFFPKAMAVVGLGLALGKFLPGSRLAIA